MAYEFDQDEIMRRLGMAAQSGRWKPWAAGGAVLLLLLIGGWTSFYTVEPEGQAVVKRFGAVVGVREPGLHFKLPFGIDRAVFVPTRRVLKEEFGFRTMAAGQRSTYAKSDAHRAESLMLSGDLNVIDVEWVVQYLVADPVKWLHEVRAPEETLRDLSESVMRQIVGNRLGRDVLTVGRVEIAALARERLQTILDTYDMGVHIANVELQDVTPPDPVKPAFNAVNEARQKKESLINEAERQRNQEIPRARGEANQTISQAEGDATQRVNEAKGAVAIFNALYEEYERAPEVTRRRLYLEMIDRVLPSAGRVYVVEEGQGTPLPLLNLGSDAPLPAGRRGQEASR